MTTIVIQTGLFQHSFVYKVHFLLDFLKLTISCRYGFLLDKALLICKRKGDSYEMKIFVDLCNYQVRDDSSAEKDNKKVKSEYIL